MNSKKIDNYDVYKTVGDALRLATWVAAAIIVVTIYVVNPINVRIRPEMSSVFVGMQLVAVIFVVAFIALHQFIAKSSLSSSRKALIYGLTLSLLLNFSCIFSIETNNLLWSGLIMNVILSVFMLKLPYALSIQAISLGAHIYLMLYSSLHDLFITQKIVLTALLIISMLIALIARRTIKGLIDSLQKRMIELESTQDELRIMNDELEQRVYERTCELENMTEELKAALDDLKTAQAQIVKDKSMKSYLALSRGISHQMNTPLGILLTTATFLNETISELKKKFKSGSLTAGRFDELLTHLEGGIDLLEGNVQRTIKAVEVLKRFSHFEESKKVEVKSMLHHLRMELNEAIELSSLKMECRIPEGLVLNIPENHFRMVLKSLMDNAVKFSSQALVDVLLEVEDKPDSVEFVVTDNGPGFETADKDKIFEPYYTTDPHSMGMGLFLAENVISHTCNGSLSIDFEYKEGARFIISLPKEG